MSTNLQGPPGPLCEVSAHQRQMFDHRRDNHICFSILALSLSTHGSRPVPTSKPSADYVLALPTSPCAHPRASTFALSFDMSSAGSAVYMISPTKSQGTTPLHSNGNGFIGVCGHQ